MIVLDGDKNRPKDDSYPGPTVRLPERVLRRRRSWSPLPDYEASEAQYRRDLDLDTKPPRFQMRIRKGVFLTLLVYALLTTVIGVPIIITKLRNKVQESWPFGNDPNMLVNPQPSSTGIVTLSDFMVCNNWNVTDSDSSPPYTSTLFTQLAPSGDISIRSNGTSEIVLTGRINGSLVVEVDSEAKNKGAQFVVNLQTTTRALQKSTLVCYSNTGDDRGLSIFVRFLDIFSLRY